MSISIILLLVAAGVLILPSLGGDEDEDEIVDNRSQIRGGPEDDTLTGTAGADLIQGFFGNDTITGNGGLDELKGGPGNDTITGGSGRDIVDGASGADKIYGLEGNDTIEGDADDDYIDAGFGSDVVRGGYGNDVILGGPGARLVDGELVDATNRDDTLRGEAGNDIIYIWGGSGLAVGGQNDVDEADDFDTLVLVTGKAELDDPAGDTKFYALANRNDDEETLAIITDFDVTEHEMILTVDAADVVNLGTLPAFKVTFLDTTLERDSGVVEAGTLVSVVLDRLTDETDVAYDNRVANFEMSSAFFRGDIFAQPGVGLDDVDVAVAFTNQSETQYLDEIRYVNVVDVLGPESPLKFAATVNKVALNFTP